MSVQSERLQLLGLNDMAHGYEALAEQAAQKNLPYCDFLEQVLDSEANVRQERTIKVRTQLAGFPDRKRLEQFCFKFPTSIDEKKIRELASLRFLEHHENASVSRATRGGQVSLGGLAGYGSRASPAE
jgi:DNA replication protein DnaC